MVKVECYYIYLTMILEGKILVHIYNIYVAYACQYNNAMSLLNGFNWFMCFYCTTVDNDPRREAI